MVYDTPILIDVIDIVANALTALQNNENISSSKAGKELYGAVSMPNFSAIGLFPRSI